MRDGQTETLTRRERMTLYVAWALRLRQEHEDTHGKPLTYEQLHSRLRTAIRDGEAGLPLGDPPSISALYRNLSQAVQSGRRAEPSVVQASRHVHTGAGTASVGGTGRGTAPQFGLAFGATAVANDLEKPDASRQTSQVVAGSRAAAGTPVVLDAVHGAPPLAPGLALLDDDTDFDPADMENEPEAGPGGAHGERATTGSGTVDALPCAPVARGQVRSPAPRGGADGPVRARLLTTLGVLESRLRELNTLVAQHDPDYRVRHRHQFNRVMKAFARSRRGAKHGRLWRLVDEGRALQRAFEGRLRELGCAPAGGAGDADSAATARQDVARTRVLHAPYAAQVLPPAMAQDADSALGALPSGRAGASLFRIASVATWPDGLQRQWGELQRLAVRTKAGMVVAEAHPKKRAVDAQVRLRLLTPVLNGEMSYDTCAAVWRALFAGAPLPPVDGWVMPAGYEHLLLTQIPDRPTDYRRKYRNLSARTLRRWHDEIKEEELQAELAGAEPPSALGVLAHKVDARAGRVRKVTPTVVKQILDLYREHRGDWTAAFIARYGREHFGWALAERTVQEVLRQHLSARERTRIEGGEHALDVLFRFHLLREATAPMDCWIMDHSWLRQEVLHPAHPAHPTAPGECRDFDFEVHAAVDRRYPGGLVERRRATRLYLSLVMDAFTRRVLAIRLWDRAPRTVETMLVLREAILQFGVPRVLYTDNGSDFRSHALAAALEAVGIQRVFSMPYSPQGRGRVERMFGKIKQMVMPGIRGYYGGRHPRAWQDADLDTVAEVEAQVWRGIEQLHNQNPNRRRKRSPVEVWEAHDSARELLRPRTHSNAAAALLGLLQCEECVRQPTGIELNGRTYLGAGLAAVPTGARVRAYFDPDRPAVIELGVVNAMGEVVSLGTAEYYDDEHPVGEIGKIAQLQAAFVGEAEAQRRERAARAEADERARARRRAGHAIATALIVEDAAAVAALSPPVTLALPALGGATGEAAPAGPPGDGPAVPPAAAATGARHIVAVRTGAKSVTSGAEAPSAALPARAADRPRASQSPLSSTGATGGIEVALWED